MDAISYSELHSRLKVIMDRVNDHHEPVIVTRKGGKSAVLLSYEHYCSLQETAYLLASPKNAEHLRTAVERLRQGIGEPHDLLDENGL